MYRNTHPEKLRSSFPESGSFALMMGGLACADCRIDFQAPFEIDTSKVHYQPLQLKINSWFEDGGPIRGRTALRKSEVESTQPRDRSRISIESVQIKALSFR